MNVTQRSVVRLLVFVASTGSLLLGAPVNSAARGEDPETLVRSSWRDTELFGPSGIHHGRFGVFPPYRPNREARPRALGDGPDLPLGGWYEPSIAVNPTNPYNVAYASLFELRVSTDGGASFQPAVVPQYPGTHWASGDPVVAFDRNGRLFWTYLGAHLVSYGANVGLDVFFAECDPATGAVLSGYPTNATVQAGLPALGGNFNDKQWIAVDRSASSDFTDRIYLAWTLFPPVGVEVTMSSYSTDAGLTWSPALQVGSAGSAFKWPVHVATAPNGDLYLAEHRQPGFLTSNPNGTSGRVRVYRSTDGGVSFGSPSLPYPAGQADMTFNNQGGGGAIPGAQFLLQGSVQPWLLPDPNVPGVIHVVAADDPDDNPQVGDAANVYITTSTDHGASWDTPRRVDSGPGESFQVMPTAAIDPERGTILVHYYDNRSGATNSEGRFLLDVFMTVSFDGGQTFVPDFRINDEPFDPDPGAYCRNNCPRTYYGLWVENENNAVAVGTAWPNVRRFDGTSWTDEVIEGATGTFNRTWGASGSDIFVVGAGGQIYHYDGSAWSSHSSGTTMSLGGIHGLSASNVLVVGQGGTILRYDGSSWTPEASGTPLDLWDVWMTPNGNAWACGDLGTLLFHDGTSWSPVDSGTDEVVFDLWGTSDTNVWAVGIHGNLLHLVDSSWTVQPSGLPVLGAIWGSSADDIWVAGQNMLHTTDGGSTWTPASFTEPTLWAIDGSSATNVFAVGRHAMMGHFDGTAWSGEPNPASENPTTRIGEYNGVAIGGGRVYAVWCGNTFDASAEPLDQQTILDAFEGVVDAPLPALTQLEIASLEPSRPNPFQRTTLFSYSLARTEPVRLTIHDVGGRTVKTLVDEVRGPGRHFVAWDGRGRDESRVAGGVYFLRLEAADEVRTQKVVVAR